MSRAELKLQAKYLLKGRYTQAILICLIPTLLSIGITYTGFLASTVYAMIHSSLLQNRSFDSVLSYSLDFSDLSSSCFVDLISFYLLTAIFWTFINLSRGKKTQISLINDGFQTISRKHLIPLFCLYILREFFFGMEFVTNHSGHYQGYAYSQAEFVYYDLYEKTGERPDLLECLKRSEQMMKGHKFEYFVLDLSFIGWQILCFMTLGLGYLWLNPYMYMTKAVFYNELAKKEHLIEPADFH